MVFGSFEVLSEFFLKFLPSKIEVGCGMSSSQEVEQPRFISLQIFVCLPVICRFYHERRRCVRQPTAYSFEVVLGGSRISRRCRCYKGNDDADNRVYRRLKGMPYFELALALVVIAVVLVNFLKYFVST